MRTTLADYAEVWMARQIHRPSTVAGKESYLRVHVLPYLGSARIGDVRPGDLEEWAKHRAKVLSPSTLTNVVGFVSAIFAAAVRDKLLATNPCDEVKVPEATMPEVFPLEPDQVHCIAEVIAPRDRALVLAGAALGMRQGELLGLSVDRVDFLRASVRVDRQLVTVANQKPFFGPVKTPTSLRTIPAPSVALDALAEHLAAYGPGTDGLIFTNADGEPIARAAIGHVWRKATRAAELGGVRFHQLRHTAASLLIAGGLSVPAVARYLGHSPAVCLRTYAHMWASDEDRIRGAMDAALHELGRPAEVASGHGQDTRE